MPTTIDDRPTKVALVSCRGILGELIRTSITDLRDVAVVGDMTFDGVDSLTAAIRRAHPDVVVWLMDDEAVLSVHPELLSADRGCAVIAVLDDGRRSASWELRPYRTELGPPSLDSLLHALRAAAVRP
ncbi:hypothetical protein MJO55_06035 [Mycolicibacterium rufum]|uniref:Uncharacterized protein n=1 Tax=Mycolicibacterium rufum TaxID=318424 RepID=A0A9X3BN70_9MYCO|nr:hypothetical protein [Mycolicibacterium rufum]KGI67118.1 hypothetical protein EU78_06210 [Mycolicibacterium rufum]MCV7070107.1 hypothetical protein [Mycolicibacterium rufum]ULP37985.1 hypothetical protein MJO55_06035 [Mycolicibacterium rufum]